MPAAILEGPISAAAPAECDHSEWAQLQGYDPDLARQEIRSVASQLEQCKQVPCPVTHHFSPGMYLREIFMPAGTFVVGHEHKTQHQNIVLTGRARVLMEGRISEIAAPCVFESGPGVQKVLYIIEDMRFITVHANPEDCTDVVKLEEQLLNLEPEFLERKGERQLDDFRMSVNQQKEISL